MRSWSGNSFLHRMRGHWSFSLELMKRYVLRLTATQATNLE